MPIGSWPKSHTCRGENGLKLCGVLHTGRKNIFYTSCASYVIPPAYVNNVTTLHSYAMYVKMDAFASYLLNILQASLQVDSLVPDDNTAWCHIDCLQLRGVTPSLSCNPQFMRRMVYHCISRCLAWTKSVMRILTLQQVSEQLHGLLG